MLKFKVAGIVTNERTIIPVIVMMSTVNYSTSKYLIQFIILYDKR